MPNDDTIAAIATAPGRGAVGIVRVSGPSTKAIVSQLIGKTLSPRVATVASFKDIRGQEIDRGIAVFFPRPNSYTSEDMLELQAHGNPVLLADLLKQCIHLGARLAEPGEFTRRAFLSGKLDLAQAEAVADVIAAQSQSALRAANRALNGHLSHKIQLVTENLLETRVLLEAGLDFPEEELDVLSEYGVQDRIEAIEKSLNQLLSQAEQGRILSEGVRVALIGAPNVGKSSILNRLAQHDVAIVTDQPGTTRDAIEVQIDVEGVPFRFIDTAGLRESTDAVEQIGMTRSQAAGEAADVLLFVVDATHSAQSLELLDRFEDKNAVVIALNKVDLVQSASQEALPFDYPTARISAKTGEGFQALLATLLQACGWHSEEQTETSFVAHTRHLVALREARDQVRAARMISPRSPELIAEELRYAGDSLGKITGKVSSDDVLGQIFAKFCIGK